MTGSRFLHFACLSVAAAAIVMGLGSPDAHAQWRGGGGWHGGGGWGGGWGWHGGGWGGGWGWRGGGWGGGWGWGFGFAVPPLYYAPPPYYYPPAYYPPPGYYPPQYGAYGYGSYGRQFYVSPPANAQPGYGAHAGLDPNNCGTPDQPMPCARR